MQSNVGCFVYEWIQEKENLITGVNYKVLRKKNVSKEVFKYLRKLETTSCRKNLFFLLTKIWFWLISWNLMFFKFLNFSGICLNNIICCKCRGASRMVYCKWTRGIQGKTRVSWFAQWWILRRCIRMGGCRIYSIRKRKM